METRIKNKKGLPENYEENEQTKIGQDNQGRRVSSKRLMIAVSYIIEVSWEFLCSRHVISSLYVLTQSSKNPLLFNPLNNPILWMREMK